mgnify:CR=1 FL=1
MVPEASITFELSSWMNAGEESRDGQVNILSSGDNSAVFMSKYSGADSLSFTSNAISGLVCLLFVSDGELNGLLLWSCLSIGFVIAAEPGSITKAGPERSAFK